MSYSPAAVIVHPSGTNNVGYESQFPLWVTGSTVAFPAVQAITGSVALSQAATVQGTVTAVITGTIQTSLTGTSVITGTVGVSVLPNITGSVNVTNSVLNVTGSVLAFPTGTQTITGSVAVNNVVVITGSMGIVSPLFVQGMAASGSTKIGNPVLVSGHDHSGSVRPFLTDRSGISIVNQSEEATFYVPVTGSQLGNNKSMVSIVNAAGSGVIIRIYGVWITNVQTSAVTGIAALFEFRRISNHSAGTQVTGVETSDTRDALNSNVTVRTGATVSGESANLMRRTYWSSDDWGPGTLDVEAAAVSFQNLFPLLQPLPKTKPIMLRAGEGLTVKHAINSTAGTFDLLIVFSQVEVP